MMKVIFRDRKNIFKLLSSLIKILGWQWQLSINKHTFQLSFIIFLSIRCNPSSNIAAVIHEFELSAFITGKCLIPAKHLCFLYFQITRGLGFSEPP